MRWGRVAVRLSTASVVLVALGSCEAGAGALGPGPDCPKVQVAGVLHVDPADPRQVWAIDIATDRVLPVRPRPALGWRIDLGSDPPALVDRAGKIATFDGEIFREACYDAATSTYYVGPEDLPNPDRQPN